MGNKESKINTVHYMSMYTIVGNPFSPNVYINPIIKNVFDFNTGNSLSIETLKYILNPENNYFYHATKFCSAINLAQNGFNKVKGSVYKTASMLGPGIYLSDNINQTFQFGNIVFVCSVHAKIILHADPVPVDQIDDFRKDYEKKIDKYDAVYMKGSVDNNMNSISSINDPATAFGEIAVKDGKNIHIHYIIELQYDTDFTIFCSNFNCTYDYGTETLNEYASINEINDLLELDCYLHSIDLTLGEIMKFINYGITEYIDENGNTRVYHSEIKHKTFHRYPFEEPGYKAFVHIYDSSTSTRKISPNSLARDKYFVDIIKIVFICKD